MRSRWDRIPFDRTHCAGRGLADLSQGLLKLRLQCLGAGSRDAGAVYEAPGDWDEREITFENSPMTGKRLGKTGLVADDATAEIRLGIDLEEKGEVSLLISPTSTDGISFSSREGEFPPELVVAYEPE